MASQPPDKPVPLAIQQAEEAADQPLVFNDEATRKKFQDELAKEAKRVKKLVDSYRQAEAISVVAGELAVNTERIKQVTRMIRFATDCETLKLIMRHYLEELKNLVKDAIKEQLEVTSKFLPITKPPSPTPWSIVKWIGKLIFGTAMPQIEAMFKLIKQIIALTKAVIDLVAAIQTAAKNLPRCIQELKQLVKDAALNIAEEAVSQVAESVGQAVGQAVGSLDRDLNGAITNAAQAFTQVKEIVGVAKTIDTSNPAAFVNSFGSAITELNSAGQTYMASDDTATAPFPILGLQTGAGAPAGAPQPSSVVVGPDTITTIVYRDGYASEVSSVPAPPPPAPA